MGFDIGDYLESNIELVDSDGILSVAGLRDGEFDSKAVFYDRVMRGVWYNRFFWGNDPANYTEFAGEALEKSRGGGGPILDVGCGPLSFTHEVYANYRGDGLILSDLSLEMLKLGKKRLNGRAPVTWLRGDALNLPFRSVSLPSILCFGLLHVAPSPPDLLKELYRVLKAGGKLYMTCLVKGRPISTLYLKMLKSKGLVSLCESSSRVDEMVQHAGFRLQGRSIGGMRYLECIKEGEHQPYV